MGEAAKVAKDVKTLDKEKHKEESLIKKLRLVKEEEIDTIEKLQKDITLEVVETIKKIHGQQYSTYKKFIKQLKENLKSIQSNIKNDKLSFDANNAVGYIDRTIIYFEDANRKGLFGNNTEKLQQLIHGFKNIEHVIIEDLELIKKQIK